MNEKNLKPLNKRSPEERKKIASQGGKAKAEKQRKSKDLQEAFMRLLDAPGTEKQKKKMLAYGLDPDTVTQREILAAAILLKAVDLQNIEAARLVIEMDGGTPVSKTKKAELALKKAEIELEKERLQYEKEAVQIPEDEKVVIINDLPKTSETE